MADYTIRKGDTLTKLSKTWGTDINSILKANPYVTNQNNIYAGKTLVNPMATAPVATAPLPQQPQPVQPTQQQTPDILEILRQRLANPAQYNPATDPAYKALSQQVEQGTMESMNSRGILNSTITRDQLAQNLAGIIPGLQQQFNQKQQDELGLYNMIDQIERGRRDQQLAEEERSLRNAWERVNTLGYVDNVSSLALGIPVGTRTFEAQNAYDNRLQQLQMARRAGSSGGGSTSSGGNQFSTVQQNAIYLVDSLMNSPTTQLSGMAGLRDFEGGTSATRTSPAITAAKEAERQFLMQAPSLGLTNTQIQQTIDLIYQYAGVSRK